MSFVPKQEVGEPKTFYTLRNGKINGIKLEEFSEFKEQELQRIVERKKPRGIHKIQISDSIAYRKAHPQTKLWYYKKKQDENTVEAFEMDEMDSEPRIPTAESVSETEEEPVAEEEENDVEYVNPESPRGDLAPLPTLAELMTKKDEDEELSVNKKSSFEQPPAVKPLIKKQIVTSSGRKLNLRI